MSVSQSSPAAPAASPPAAAAPAAAARRRWWMAAAGVAVVLVIAIGFLLVVPLLFGERTNDAYIDAHLVSVVPKVPAYVQALHVDDNTNVEAGELLLELDPRDFVVQVSQAQANLEAATSKVKEALEQAAVSDAAVRERRAELGVSQASAEIADVNLKRLRSVADARAVSSERVDEARTTAEGALATVAAARVKVDEAKAQAHLAQAQVTTARAAEAQAQAGLDQARLNLSYTKIFATEPGSIANKTVENGNFVQPGQLLMSIVPSHLFVIANYKETQLAKVRPGQAVRIRVDAMPQVRFTGHVDSIQRGSGSRFALLPPENATGNFVKVVQRIPVKVALDGPAEALKLISPGMSVEAEIEVGGHKTWSGPHQ